MDGTREPIGRGAQARARILAAALEVLAEAGMRGFTIESVARRAGASKATVYRHWSSTSELLVDAMDVRFRMPADLPTGDLREDLITVLSTLAQRLSDSPFPRLLAAFIDAAERHPDLPGLHTELTKHRRAPVLQLLADAQERGEIVLPADPEVVVDMLAAPFFYRRLVAHRPIPDTMAMAVVDQVLAGLRPVTD